MKNKYKDQPNIIVVPVDDKKIGLTGKFDIPSWRAWCNELFTNANVDPNENTCRWYTGEQHYADKLSVLYPNHYFFIADRSKINISGTQIRQHPNKNKKFIDKDFYEYLKGKKPMITEDRLHHILGVARKAYKVAKELGTDEQFAREMFALGWNHDIGYEFDPHTHETIGYQMLKNWKYSKYIATHGKVDNVSVNLIWFIINYADMTTSPTGEEVTLNERLEEIESRYGKEHTWYIESKKVCDMLIKYKEDNNLCLMSTSKLKE